MKCILCESDNLATYAKKYLKCGQCKLVFKHPDTFLDIDEEIKRYSTHENSIESQGYVKYLSSILAPLVEVLPKNSEGLDFGCGPGPTLSVMLTNNGLICDHYDPAFFPSDEKLQKKYDFVTSTEVFEHFHNPKKEIEKIWSLIKDNGYLGVMTVFYPVNEDDFQMWWYKNDPTHVCFYNEEVFNFLAQKLDAKVTYYDNKTLILKKGF